MYEDITLRHFGGGRKGLFLVLRYLFIIAASYLLLYQNPHAVVVSTSGMMIVVALVSNVGLSLVPAPLIFSWYVEAPVLIADTLWVSWAIHSLGTTGPEFFLLYFFVLFLAMLGENLAVVVLGSTVVSLANVLISNTSPWTTPQMLRVVFFYSVALFYGYVINEIKRERQRADRGFAWARELEAKVAERTEQLSRLYHESVAANHLKSEFLANMSHGLRTPLSIITGYLELLLDKRVFLPEAERGEMMRRALVAARAQTDLVESVLDLGKFETGKMPVNGRPVPLDDFVGDLKRRPRIAAAPQVEMRWHVAPRLPVIETDPEQLANLLDHLINNAIQFTKSGTVSVSIGDISETKHVEFRVEDTGPGIDPTDLPTIFEPFRKAEWYTTSRAGGFSVGLAIVQRSVQLLGGEISVNSTLGCGTTFVVTLPYYARLTDDLWSGKAKTSGSESATSATSDSRSSSE